MPVYEYRCRTCGHQFDIQQSFTDDALTTCPECGGELRKVFAPVGISFKGSGFYKTDSRSSSSSSKGSNGSGSGSSTEGSSSSGGSSGDGSSGSSESSSTTTTSSSSSSAD
jgi:putative FmdB family regulatory protein